MELSGKFTVPTSVQTTAESLADAKWLSRCLPSLMELKVPGPEEFLAKFKIDLGGGLAALGLDYLSRLTVRMHFRYLEKDTQNIKLEATGRVAGSNIGISITLHIGGLESGTIVEWSAQAEFGTLLKLVGEDRIRGMASTVIEELTTCLKAQLGSAKDGKLESIYPKV